MARFLLIFSCLSVASAACGKSPVPAAAPAPAPPALATAATATAAEPVNGTQNSEHIATNKADPNCKTCVSPDAGAAPPSYFGKPDMALDEKTLNEVQASIDANSEFLEQGIDILEKNAKTPDKALAVLEKYLADKQTAITTAQEKAAEIRARLKAVGYDQDIPAEIRPSFEARMGKISERLEQMRTVYAQRRDVLTAFGRLFPRPK